MSLTVHGIPVIDIDSHYTEPPDLWTSRAPAKYKDSVPHITLNDEGQQRWTVLDDIDFGPPGFTVVREDGSKEYGSISLASFEQMSKAATDPKARLKLLDDLGIAQQIVYPNVAGFGSQNFVKIEDHELRNVCCTVYNDAIAEFQDEGAGRLFPQGLVPFWDIPGGRRRTPANQGSRHDRDHDVRHARSVRPAASRRPRLGSRSGTPARTWRCRSTSTSAPAPAWPTSCSGPATARSASSR